MNDAGKHIRRRIRVMGTVQGVGFRPWIYRLATARRLAGFVLNDARGVVIEVEGPAETIDEFTSLIRPDGEARAPGAPSARHPAEAVPPLAVITGIETSDIEPRGDAGDGRFVIRASETGDTAATQVSPDMAVCDDCRRELFDPADRRYRYPFINCTHCGPRYSIILDVPYDRPRTTMREFAMCPDCRREYDDPADRRFHAQPNACPVCGPHLSLHDAEGRTVESADPVAFVREKLLAGAVVALKGLTGFHLACDARSQRTVTELRRRKQRDEKPLAVMVADADEAARLVCLDAPARRLLTSPERPIVLVPRRDGRGLAPSVAPKSLYLGLMLPYAPLHWLLFADRFPPMVMTSANLSEEPMCRENDETVRRLAGIADWYLLHDRGIQTPCDDSVATVQCGVPLVIRRARGYAPRPIRPPSPSGRGGASGAEATEDRVRASPSVGAGLVSARPSPFAAVGAPPACPERSRGAVPAPPSARESGETILAVGPELKNCVCLTRGTEAYVSQHIGDLKNPMAVAYFEETVDKLRRLLEVTPTVVAHDLHPAYYSTRYAAGLTGVRLTAVQHHHAHAASVMAEHGLAGPVLGLCMDGTGYGTDGTTWGSEFLEVRPDGTFARLGHLGYVRLPGGDAAMEQVTRIAWSHLVEAFGDEADAVASRLMPAVTQLERSVWRQMMVRGVNAPPACGLGRLFDAASALAGVATRSTYEGQAAVELEAVAEMNVDERFDYEMIDAPGPGGDGAAFEISTAPLIRDLVAALDAGESPGRVSARFHNTVVAFLLDGAERSRRMTGLDRAVLAGGCFLNRYVTERLVPLLEARGLAVYRHRAVSPGDGGVALGQAEVARQRLAAGTL